MNILDILNRRRRTRVPRGIERDWTNAWTIRDWADLPTWHPRRGDDAR